MRRGDIVRLRQPLQLNTGKFEEFTHGIIAARIKTNSGTKQKRTETLPLEDIVRELIVYLYEPETARICLDEDGIPILFDLEISDVILFKTVKKRTDEIQSEDDSFEQ